MQQTIPPATGFETCEYSLPERYPQPGSLNNLNLTEKTSRLRTVLTLLCVTALYFITAKMTLLWVEGVPQATLLWLPAGVALASILLCGYRILPAIFAGSLLENMEAGHKIFVSTGIALGHTLPLFLCVWIVRRFFLFNNDINHPKDILTITIFPILLGSALNAAIGIAVIRLAGLQEGVALSALWRHWWLGNINGALFVTPVLLLAFNRRLSFLTAFWREAMPLIIGLTLICTAIFGPWQPEEMSGKFLIFPLMILAAYRFGQYGATFTLFITMMTATWWLDHDSNVLGINSEDLPLLQIFMSALALTGLFLGAAMSERQRLEQQLKQYSKALEHSNQELDDFTYIVSHDLKEPLRGLKSFSQFLVEEYAEKIDGEGKRKLHIISNLTHRLETLLDTLLYYSRVGRAEKAVSEANLEEIVRDVIAMLSISLKEKNVTVELRQKLPVIKCNRVRIQEVFQNLVTNAIKYNDNEGNKIEIGFLTDHPAKPEEMVFYVRDHGIGISKDHLDAVFTIFKRLHAKDAYGGGTGSGLAIVKKIIAQHDGDVWAESDGEGKGTAFFFTIPQQ
jgi:signal transduction histidine kinase